LEYFSPELIANFGLTGGLFVGLLIYVLKENTKREEQYRILIKELTDTLNTTLKNITCDVSEIKNKVEKIIENGR